MTWDSKKKKAFVTASSKTRAKFAKGGPVQRFVGGGTVHALEGPNTSLVQQNATNPNTGIAGTISGALGLNDNFQAGSAMITPGTNTEQLNDAYTTATGALQQQMDLTHTLSPQAAQAVQHQSDLANQYAAMTRGEGPNPARAQLHQATGQNIASQAALMAGQRGANQNAGLMARQIANQGAQTQQQAAGQDATLEAQQQIAAQDKLANLSESQVGQAQGATTGANTAAQNEQNILQGANTAANNAAVGMQSNVNNTNAQTSMANQAQAGKTLSSVVSMLPVIGGMLAKGGVVEPHVKLAEMNAVSLKHHYAGGGGVHQSPMESYFAPVAQQGGPSIESTPDMASKIPKNTMDDDIKGTMEKLKKKEPETTTGTAADWEVGGGMAGGPMDAGSVAEAAPALAAHGGMMKLNYCHGPHKSHVANFLAEGGKVKSMVSPGEIYLSPEKVSKVINEDVDPKKIGQKIGGKAKVKGDSYENDTVPMDLQEGGVVIDRENMGTREKRLLFVHKSIARKKAGAK